MALNDSSIFGFVKAPELGFSTFKPASSSSSSRLSVKYLKHGLDKFYKWECCCLRVLSPKALTPIENDEKPLVAGVGESSCDEGIEILCDDLDANLLSNPLTANEFSSRDNGSKLRVAFKGLPGAYTEDAALLAYPTCETVPCDDFETSFKAVESWLVDKAVLPIESSVGGSIHRNYDLLLRHKLHIVGEVQLLINHCLLGLAGARKEELRAVMSHPQALVQCKTMLNNLGVAKIGVDDPAAAAKEVVLKGRKEIGAVAGSRAADIYGLDILAKGIQDEDVNVTRFLILARDQKIPGTDRPYKTSIVFTLEEGPGALFKALGAFALRNINLSKIESRPLKQSPLRIVEDLVDGSAKYFEYLFYIDFEASMADSLAQSALENLQEYTKFIRVLGCYPVEKTDTLG